MGKEKYQKEIRELFKKSPVVNYNSVERIIENKKKVKQYTKQLVRNLILKQDIKRLVKGYYTNLDDPSLAVFCLKPAYLGLQDALSFHNLWEQETIPIIITTRKVRSGLRKVMGTNILIRRIQKKYFFGFDYSPQNNIPYPYSDIEKTFIDMIYFKERLSKEAIKNIVKKLNIKKLNIYLKNYPKKMKLKILKTLKNKHSHFR